jgi:hypothetical protein
MRNKERNCPVRSYFTTSSSASRARGQTRAARFWLYLEKHVRSSTRRAIGDGYAFFSRQPMINEMGRPIMMM